MFSSVTYMEIRCRYNHSYWWNLETECKVNQKYKPIVFRSRTYYIGYADEENCPAVYNSQKEPVIFLDEGFCEFHLKNFHPKDLSVVSSFLAFLNIYPIK